VRAQVFGALLLASNSCATSRQAADERRAEARDREPPRASETADPILPLPHSRTLDAGRVALGASLFQSPLLSGDASVSCASCHHEQQGWADRAAHTQVAARPATALNVPTLANLQYYFYFSWNGAYDDLAAHADSLLENPDIMGTTWSAVAARLALAPGWQERFAAVFSAGLRPENVRAALVEYEASLSMPDSPFDRWLQGDGSAISVAAERGYRLFESRGCVSCHQGMLLGGNLFQRLGVMRDYDPAAMAKALHAEPAPAVESRAELGRFTLTGREEDRHVFRVPSLRNVALTAPYLHDGSVATLADVVDIMAEYQLGELLGPDENQSIVQFLDTLSGRSQGAP
jgi:cytochrome c peroxidase